MPDKIEKTAIIVELQRVAQILDTKHVGSRDFQKLATISISTVRARFGSWNNALQAAGLLPAISRPKHSLIVDDDLLLDIITVTHKLKKIPSQSEMLAHGKYSTKPYRTRWGSFTQAREAAYKKYGTPSEVNISPTVQVKPSPHHPKKTTPDRAVIGAANNLKPHLLKIKNSDTRNFVEEAIDCLEMELYRSAVVMSWVGAVSILYDYVLENKLDDFNSEAKRRNPKWKIASTKDDLSLMKESDFLDVLASLSIIGKNVKEQLKNNCLSLRNACGHPNSFRIGRSMVEGHLETLLLNIYEVF